MGALSGAASRLGRGAFIVATALWAASGAVPASAQTQPGGTPPAPAAPVLNQTHTIEGPYGPYSDLVPGRGQWSSAQTPYANLPQGYVPPAAPGPGYGAYPKPPTYVPPYRQAPPPAPHPPPAYAGNAAQPHATPPAPRPAPAPGPADQQPPRQIAAAPELNDHYGPPLWGFLSQAIVDVADHDAGIFGNNKEPGKDIGFEFRFLPIDWLEAIASPRPNIGAHINTAGATSQIYTGIVWEFWFWNNFYVNPAFGLSFNNDDKLTEETTDRKQLGSPVLFREALELGWNFYGPHSISVLLDHVSHGTMFNRKNEGLDDLAVRYSYRF